MKRFKKNWIKVNNDTNVQDQETEIEVTEKEEEKMGFFAKHKKGLIIGGLGALAAGAAGLFLASRKDSEDDYEEIDDDFDFEDAEIEELTETEAEVQE